MGEIIRVLCSVGDIDVELNKASVRNGERYIHLQNSRGRFCIRESEFVRMAIGIRSAGEKFFWGKGLKDKND